MKMTKQARRLKVQLYRHHPGILKQGWRWRIRAENGRIVGASSEGYARRGDCVANLALVVGIDRTDWLDNVPAEFIIVRDQFRLSVSKCVEVSR